ncbi:MAG TPA: alkaline phosphatase PhoX [Pseudonocardiaceae bacterium]
MLVAEDGQGVQHLFGATEQGETFPVARNDIDDNEFTGPVYSPDHRILFANLQTPGSYSRSPAPGTTRADVALGPRE